MTIAHFKDTIKRQLSPNKSAYEITDNVIKKSKLAKEYIEKNGYESLRRQIQTIKLYVCGEKKTENDIKLIKKYIKKYPELSHKAIALKLKGKTNLNFEYLTNKIGDIRNGYYS